MKAAFGSIGPPLNHLDAVIVSKNPPDEKQYSYHIS
jgi:hypothetical protein